MPRLLGPVALLVLALLALPAAADESVAPACTPPPARGEAAPVDLARSQTPGLVETRVRLTRWSTRLVHGQHALLEGQVVTDDGAISSAAVELFARPAGSDTWSHRSSTATDPETGVFHFGCLDTPRTTTYRIVFEGTVVHDGSSSARRVRVARRVDSDMRLRPDGRFGFRGVVTPRYAGRPVVLQRKACPDCSWERVATRSTSRRSRWSFVVSAPRRGDRYFRVLVPRDTAFVTGRSSVWRVSR